MTPINVFIDTSVLYTFGAAFDRLQYLASIDVVRIFLSHIVVREWMSHLETDLRKSIEGSKSNLRDLINSPYLSEIDRQELLIPAYEYLSQLLSRTTEISQKRIEGILAHLRAQVMPVENAHGTVIIDAYFNGDPPFRSKKSRQDFPDAFILENARETIRKVGAPLYCVVADGPLANALNSIEGIILHGSLKDFVQSEEVKSLASEKEQERIWLSIFEFISGNLSNASEEVEGSLEKLLLDRLPGEKVEHNQIPDDNNEASIYGLYEPENIQIDWEAAEDYGNGNVTIPFNCQVMASIEFFVFRADAYDVPDEIWVDFQDPETHYYFDAGGDVILDVSGTIKVRFMVEKPNEGDLPEILDLLINDIEDVTVIEDADGNIFVQRIDIEKG